LWLLGVDLKGLDWFGSFGSRWLLLAGWLWLEVDWFG